MATIKVGKTAKRAPSHQKRFIVDTYRGQLRVRSWPRKRKPSLPASTKERMLKFGSASVLAKYVFPEEQIIAQRVTRGTPLMPRDIQVAAMYGRLFSVDFGHGERLYPVAARQDVSQSLDVLENTPGSMLVRAGEFWIGLGPGDLGKILTAQGPNDPPIWADAPPSAAHGRVIKSSLQALTANVQARVTYQVVSFDPEGAWDAANNRWVIPAGFNRCRVHAGSRATTLGSASTEQLSLWKNGVAQNQLAIVPNQQFTLQVDTGVIDCAENDTFECQAFCGATRTLAADRRNNFSITMWSA